MTENMYETTSSRVTGYTIHSLIQNRWSPRSMTGEELTDEELMPLFEAARWAPSSYNSQLWKFLYAKRKSENWNLFFNLMIPFNQNWTKNAAVLVVVISRKFFEHNNKIAPTHSYDAGAAWENLALEGNSRGYVVHGMQGFDYDKAREVLEIPEEYQVEAMAAIGKRASKEELPPELQEKEIPSERRPLQEIVIEGKFKSSKP